MANLDYENFSIFRIELWSHHKMEHLFWEATLDLVCIEWLQTKNLMPRHLAQAMIFLDKLIRHGVQLQFLQQETVSKSDGITVDLQWDPFTKL